MTVLDTTGARGASNSTTVRYMVGMFLVLIGVILGLGIARWTETASGDALVTYVGPSVERSLAMEQSQDVLEEWGRAQASALASDSDSGPLVERSLAMEQSHDVLEEWGRVHAELLAAENG